MLGRQSSLLLTDVDLEGLETMLRKRGDVEFLSSQPNVARDALLPLETLAVPLHDAGKVSLFCYLAPKHIQRRVQVRVVSPVKIRVSAEESDVIELWRPYYPGAIIRAGRVFYTVSYFEGGFHDKEPEFAKWAQGTVSAIRRYLPYDKERGAYLGHDAASKIAAGELTVVR